MMRKIGFLIGLVFCLAVPQTLFAYQNILDCVWENENCDSKIYDQILDLYEEFKERYDLSNSKARSFLSDSQIQEVIKALEKKNADKKEIFHIMDIINDIHSIKEREFEALTAHGNLEKILDYIDAIDDSEDIVIPDENFEDYFYEARNCKVYNITYLPESRVYVSPDFQRKEYFVSSKYLERYIETKNPGTCKIIKNFTLDTTFENKGSVRYVAPNGKVYFLKKDDE
ncbi:hypothetical protein IJM86_03745 [bacterium]|nr:hypothetical protein [bacterium]